MQRLRQSPSLSLSSCSKFDMKSINSQLPNLPVDHSDTYSNKQSYQSQDPLNMGFMVDQESSLVDSTSLRLSQLSSIELIKSSDMNCKVNKMNVFSDVSSLLNQQIEQQQQEDSMYQMVDSIKRKSNTSMIDEESIPSNSCQFKKKRILDTNQIKQTISNQQVILDNKFPRRYQTRQQTLKIIDDKFQKQMKQMKQMKPMEQ